MSDEKLKEIRKRGVLNENPNAPIGHASLSCAASARNDHHTSVSFYARAWKSFLNVNWGFIQGGFPRPIVLALLAALRRG